MELRVNEVAIPQEIKILNFEELKTELEAKADYYGSLAYTDEQIKDAKADRAQLNKFKNTVNSERIRKEKEYMKLFNEFKSQVNELIAIVEKPIAVIDERIAAYSDEQKAKKQKAIEELFATIGFQNFVTLEKIWDPKWLNVSTSMKSIEDQMRSRMYEIGNDVLTLHNLPELGFEATEVYKQTLDINVAVSEAKKMVEVAKKKAEAKAREKAAEEARKAEEERKAQERAAEEQRSAMAQAMTPPEDAQQAPTEEPQPAPVQSEPKFLVKFEAIVTEKQAVELAAWLTERHIQFKQIR